MLLMKGQDTNPTCIEIIKNILHTFPKTMQYLRDMRQVLIFR